MPKSVRSPKHEEENQYTLKGLKDDTKTHLIMVEEAKLLHATILTSTISDARGTNWFQALQLLCLKGRREGRKTYQCATAKPPK